MKREECLDIVQRMIADGIITQDDAAKYFSELKESEDERIRRGLINGFNFYGEQEYWGTDKFQLKVKDIIAWLEKQDKNDMGISEATKKELEDSLHKALEKETSESYNEFLDKQGEEKSNPYSGVSFAYNGHTWGMCARDNGVEILIDGHIKGRVFTNDSNAKEMFIKALERVEEENTKGYKLTDCDKNSWWEDFKAYASCSIEQKYTDKVEPKFHEGDMIIHKELGGDYIHNPHKIIQVDILDKKYRFKDGYVIHFSQEDDYELVEQKPAWSEEDEKLVKNLISTLSNLYARNLIEKETKEKYTNLLKSLKERLQLQPTWKPSDEQMKVIQESVGIVGELTPRGECLKELEE